MADFDKAIKVVLQHEGGYVNNPNDPGGVTNYGISLRFLAQHPNEGDFNQDGHVDAEDIASMTWEQAKKVYCAFWWDPFKYSLIPDQTIATKVFDFAINMGATRSHMLLQQSLNSTYDVKLTCDGVLGPASMRVLCAVADGDEEQKLLKAYSDAAWAFYQSLIAKNPKLVVFQKGWKNRAYAICSANSMS